MTMGSLRQRIRAFAVIWGVLQFALPFAVLLVDAGTPRGAGSPVSHVETSTSPNCIPAHADECALCRFLSNNGASVPRAELVPVVLPARVRPVAVPPTLAAAAGHRLPGSRAPPTV